MQPKTLFNYSKKTEAIRLGYVACRIRTGFYQKKGFAVLPYHVPNHTGIIYFPHLPYDSIPHFWDIVNTDIKNLLRENSPVFESIEKIMDAEMADFTRIQKDWREKEKEFWTVGNHFLPELFQEVNVLEVRPTRFGGKISIFQYPEQKHDSVTVYIRDHADSSHIAEGLLLDRCVRGINLKDYTWEEKEAIMDFLMVHTKLSEIYPGFMKTLPSIRLEQQAKYAMDSQKYLEQLGLQFKKVFSLKQNGIYAQNKKLELTDNEAIVMKLLIVNKNQIVSFDAIADALWQNDVDERFSLSAITKLMERLRKKIYDSGVHTEAIQTQKGRGYVLHD